MAEYGGVIPALTIGKISGAVPAGGGPAWRHAALNPACFCLRLNMLKEEIVRSKFVYKKDIAASGGPSGKVRRVHIFCPASP
ncbi:MAG: hypothetical protein OHK0024_26470 [Thalassobaculales bacterium]